MNKIIFVAGLLFVATVFAVSKNATRTPQSAALTVDLAGYFASPSNDNASIVLEGQDLKTHLMSRFTNGKGKNVSVKVTADCESESKCTLELSR